MIGEEGPRRVGIRIRIHALNIMQKNAVVKNNHLRWLQEDVRACRCTSTVHSRYSET